MLQVAARHVAGEESRQAVNLRAGRLFAERALQRPLDMAAAAAAASGTSSISLPLPPPASLDGVVSLPNVQHLCSRIETELNPRRNLLHSCVRLKDILNASPEHITLPISLWLERRGHAKGLSHRCQAQHIDQSTCVSDRETETKGMCTSLKQCGRSTFSTGQQCRQKKNVHKHTGNIAPILTGQDRLSDPRLSRDCRDCRDCLEGLLFEQLHSNRGELSD